MTQLPTLCLVVIRSDKPEDAVRFYGLLGLSFQNEQHGNGPVHWSSNLDGTILEIYPATSDKQVDSSTRLGFTVDGIMSKLDSLRSIGIEIVSEPKKSEWGLRAVVNDPDGRSVELLQK